ncbi:phenylacetaldehyde oxime monooxygenase CYP71AN24-like [Rosa rugosa]|uniref:phenylacetaldehyde oxime monooxygenase CYP71AN24-like n=1 Tax=Rosa rugosa TaxID=74645 RepID=UPI002B407C8B|nr:phenylacetaldehyde oxime monooxygenase CYP71AN24-like [Rosa rugosa]
MALLNQFCEELNTSTVFNPFLVSLLLLFIFVLFSLSRSVEKLKTPPSPTRLPIIGNLHQVGTLPHRSLHALSKKYGPLMLLHLGQVPTLVVSSANMAKEIMKTHDSVCCSRPKSTAANILLYGCGDIAYSPYGEYWRQVRKLCVVELLSLKRVQQFEFAREEEVTELVKSIRKACLRKSPINLSDMLSTTFNNILSRCVTGNRFVEENDNWFGEASRRLLVQLTTFSFGDMFPCLRWIDNLRGFIASLKATSAKLDGFFDQLIEEHKTTKAEGMPETSDFVDILVKLQKDDILNLDLTQDNLKAILQDMFIGGSDTTATALEWLMAELVRNPSVMKKLQQEVRRVVGKKEKIDVDDINQMDFLKCVNKETLRLHPPAPLLLPRETIAAVTLGGYYIPAKTRILVNAFAIQRDPKFWDKPEEFLPERFEDNSIDFKGQDFQFVPFGGGRRGCPGLAFAVAGAEYVVANLLYWFDWKLPNDNVSADALDMSEVFGITVHKKAPLHLVPIPYSP